MNCYYHNDTPAVAQCQNCGKFLCKACTDRHPIPLCEVCYEELSEEIRVEEENEKKSDRRCRIGATVIAIPFSILYLMIIIALFPMSVSDFIGIVIAGICTVIFCSGYPYGWRAISNKYKECGFTGFSFIRLFIHLYGAFLIGWFCMLKHFVTYMMSREEA